MARNPACGLSASRRAAMSEAGLVARRAMARAPAIVSQGPATTSPAITSSIPDKYAAAWPVPVSGRTEDDEVGQHALSPRPAG